MIDWVLWNRKSMNACADESMVEWVKLTIPAMDSDLGARLPHEGLYEQKRYRIKVPLPTGNRPSSEILDRILVGNKLEGLLTKIAEIQTERALVLIVTPDNEIIALLQNRGNKSYWRIMRLFFQEEGRGPGPPSAVTEPKESGGPWREKLKNKRE